MGPVVVLVYTYVRALCVCACACVCVLSHGTCSHAELWVDGLLVFRGGIRQAPPPTAARSPSSSFCQSILFTDDANSDADRAAAQAEKEAGRVCYCGSEEQDVLVHVCTACTVDSGRH